MDTPSGQRWRFALGWGPQRASAEALAQHASGRLVLLLPLWEASRRCRIGESGEELLPGSFRCRWQVWDGGRAGAACAPFACHPRCPQNGAVYGELDSVAAAAPFCRAGE